MTEVLSSHPPLVNRMILVACSANKLDALVTGIQSMGGKALAFPVIEVREVEDKRPLDEALATLHEYAWIIFTSAYGVRFFVQRLNQAKLPTPARGLPRICAIGPATAREVQQSGYQVELVPEKFVAEGLIEALGKYHGGLEALAGRRVLIPRAKEAREVLPEALAAAGVLVNAVPCYETVRAAAVQEVMLQLRNRKPDMLVFTSSSAIRNFIEILGKGEGTGILLESAVAVLGPVTGSTAESLGKIPEVLPKENTIPSLLAAIREYYTSGG